MENKTVNLKRITLQNVAKSTFLQLPSFLLNGEFKKLDNNARVLYSLLSSRHRLSIKNGLVNDKDEVYFFMKREQMQELIGVSENTVTKAIKLLKEYGLLEEIRRGQGKTNMMFLLEPDFIYPDEIFSDDDSDVDETGEIPVDTNKKITDMAGMNVANQEPQNIRFKNLNIFDSEFSEPQNMRVKSRNISGLRNVNSTAPEPENLRLLSNSLLSNNLLNHTDFNNPFSPDLLAAGTTDEQKKQACDSNNNNDDKNDNKKIIYSFSHMLQARIDEWLEYKKEKKQQYGKIGLKKALEIIGRMATEHGEKSVAEIMDYSMSCNYATIAWDRIKKQPREQVIDNAYDCNDPDDDNNRTFKILWSKVKRKEGEENARQAFLKAVESGVPVEKISCQLEAYNKHVDANKFEFRHIKTGGNWFAERCWENEYDMQTGAKKPKTPFHNFSERDYDWAELEAIEKEYLAKKHGFEITEREREAMERKRKDAS